MRSFIAVYFVSMFFITLAAERLGLGHGMSQAGRITKKFRLYLG